MKAKELRIGNYYIENNQVCRVEHYDISSAYFNPDMYKPIPLTEEWLLKFGFVWELDKSYSLTINENNGLFIWVDLNTLHPIAELIDSSDRVVANHIEYIHQLQNLYFALTGEELKLLKD